MWMPRYFDFDQRRKRCDSVSVVVVETRRSEALETLPCLWQSENLVIVIIIVIIIIIIIIMIMSLIIIIVITTIIIIIIIIKLRLYYDY
jgi:type IV secretory pathway VirB6-like protein